MASIASATRVEPVIHVAVGVLSNARGEILIARRPEHVHQGGLWEFPGGKLEPGELLIDALRRELSEELGIRVEHSRPLIRIAHDYGDKAVLLDVHRVTAWSGEAAGCEGQPLAWVAPERLMDYSLPAADRPIVTALRLPDRYLITGQDPTERAGFLASLRQALEDGLRLVQLRAKGLSPSDYEALAEAVVALCWRHGARLLLNGPPDLVRRIGADGVHLTSQALRSLTGRPLGEDFLVGASCHSGDDLCHAQRIGVDFAVLSAVLATTSHSDGSPLGWTEFARLVAGAGLPVFALGGMSSAHIVKVQRLGGQGVAGISGFWPATEPGA